VLAAGAAGHSKGASVLKEAHCTLPKEMRELSKTLRKNYKDGVKLGKYFNPS